MNNFLIAQILGVILIILCVTSIQMKTKQRIVFVSLIANLVFVTQFIFLGRWTGVIVGAVTVMRCLIFYLYARKGKRSPVWILAVLILLYIGGVIWTWDSWYCAFTLLAVINIYGQWQTNVKFLRLGLLSANIGIGIYSVLTMAYMGALNELLQIFSVAIALWRYRNDKTHHPSNNK